MNRSIAPSYTQPHSLEIRLPKKIKLANEVDLFWIDDVKDDSVKLDIEWSAGSKYQPKKLVANFTNRLLLSGTENQSAEDIASEMDYHGGFLNHEVDRDHAGITLYGLRQSIGAIFEVFANGFMQATFPEEQFEKERSVARMRFLIDGKKVKNQCSRRFNAAIFGADSEYGQVAEESDFDVIKREDIIDFHRNFYRNGKPTFFLVGRVDEAFIQSLDKWVAQLDITPNTYEAKPLNQEKGRIEVPVENAIQSAVRVGRLMFNKNHPDYFKFQLLNTALGGYFGSRLMTNIREDKGYTYGISTGLSVLETAAYFFLSTEVGVEFREATIQEILNELEDLRTNLIPEDELQKVKNYMLGDFLRHADGPIAMMENFKNIHFNRLKETYYSDFIKAVNEATAEELRTLAQTYLQEKDLVVVTAG